MRLAADQNLQILREIEINRDFLLLAYRDNPALLARAEPRIRQLFVALADDRSNADAIEPLTQRQDYRAIRE